MFTLLLVRIYYVHLCYIFKLGERQPVAGGPGFLKSLSCSMYVCMCVCTPPRP